MISAVPDDGRKCSEICLKCNEFRYLFCIFSRAATAPKIEYLDKRSYIPPINNGSLVDIFVRDSKKDKNARCSSLVLRSPPYYSIQVAIYKENQYKLRRESGAQAAQ